MAQQNIIQVDNLNFSYPATQALSDINFCIPENTITALVGPNGAGKTTLMRCLSALLTPLSGTIIIDNVDVIKNPRKTHTSTYYLPDFAGLYGDLSVNNIFEFIFASYNIKLDRQNTLKDLVLSYLDIKQLYNSKAGTLSRGQRQKVSIATAIFTDAKVLLLDEPASGLDPEARFKLAKLLKELQQMGKTIMVSSHILAELEDYSTHMLVLNNNKLVTYNNQTLVDTSNASEKMQDIYLKMLKAEVANAKI